MEHQDSTFHPLLAAEETLAKLSAETGSPLACLYGILDVTFLYNACLGAVCRTTARYKSQVDQCGGAKTTSTGKSPHIRWRIRISAGKPAINQQLHLQVLQRLLTITGCAFPTVRYLWPTSAASFPFHSCAPWRHWQKRMRFSLTWRCLHMICMRCICMMIFFIGSSKVCEERTIHVISDVNGGVSQKMMMSFALFRNCTEVVGIDVVQQAGQG